MNKLNLLAVAICLFATFIYSIFNWELEGEKGIDIAPEQLTPDFIARTLKSNIYNKNGNLSHVIDAQQMEHYEKIDVTQFKLPFLTLIPENENAPWEVSANQGTLFTNNRVRLENRVKLVATDKDSLIQEIRGKYFELDLNTNIISSEQTVLILGKGFTIYGSGFIVDINTKQMTLTEHVQTIYEKS